MKNFAVKSFLLISMISVLFSAHAFADTLSVVENEVASTPSQETTPTLGTDIVVYTVRDLVNGVPDQGDIWYRPLDAAGAPIDVPVQVTSDPTDDQFNDTSGDYIVYTSYDTIDSASGAIMLYEISTASVQQIGDAIIIQEPRIHGNVVVWVQGGFGASEVMIFELAWLTDNRTAQSLTGPVPPTFNVDIGDRFAVWVEESGDYDIGAYDFTDGTRIRLTDTSLKNELHPSTSGDWIVWESQDHGDPTKRIEAVNLETGDYRIIRADEGYVAGRPSIHGDLITYESNIKGNYDVYVYRISTEETFAVTFSQDDQYLSDVYGDLIAYVDVPTFGQFDQDVWVASLTFVAPSIPDIEVSPTDYNFGDVELGSSTTTIVTISNVGGADLTLSDVSFQEGSCGDLSITSYTLFQPDQVNEYPTGTSHHCGTPPAELGSLFQSFTPSALSLSGVDLLLRAGGGFPTTGYDTTINIRSNDPGGDILGTATTFVPGPLTAGLQKMVRFSFSEEISLIPGGTYIIEWISPQEGGVILGWMGADTNPYPGGTAFGCGGTAVANTDFVFKTYSITSPISPGIVAPNGTLDVEIAYSPLVVGPCSGTLEVASNDPDESPVQVSLIGNGVVVEPPPNEQIATILDSIDGWVADGTLAGDGPGRSAEKRLNALKNMIETAGDLIDDGDIAGACVQLRDAYRKTDGLTPPESPPDFVTGDSADDLAQMILDLMASLGC